MPDRKKAPLIKDPAQFEINLPKAAIHTLSNGVDVYLINMGTEDTLMINWVFYAGNSYEKKNNVAAATNFLLKNGTSRLKAFEINEHFDFYGAYLNRAAYNETSELTLHCLSKHTAELIPVVAELVQDSVFPEDEIAIYTQNSKQRLKVGLQKSDFVAGRLIDAYLFGEKHPYGKFSRLEDYDMLERQDLVEFHHQHYREGNAVIFVAGKIPSALIQQLEAAFGNLPLRNHRHAHNGPVYAIEPSAEKKHHVVNDEQGVQSAIRIARHFPNRHHPDFQKCLVLNNVFGGFFGSRLMANIREEKGYTYGIYSYMMNHVHQSAWLISTEAGREVSEATIREVYKEMQDLRENEIDEEELQVTRSYMIGSILGDIDGPFHIAGRWKNLVLNGLDESYFENSIRLIKTVTPRDLHELANKYLVPEAFYELQVI